MSRHPVACRNVHGPVLFIAHGNVKTAVLVIGQLVVSDAGRKFVLHRVIEAREKGEAEVATFRHFRVPKADTIFKGEVRLAREEVVGVRQGAEGTNEGFVVLLRAARHVRDGQPIHGQYPPQTRDEAKEQGEEDKDGTDAQEQPDN